MGRVKNKMFRIISFEKRKDMENITEEEIRRIMHPTEEELHQEFLVIMEKAKNYIPTDEEIAQQDFIWEQVNAGVPNRKILKALGHTEEELKMWDRIEPVIAEY